MKRLPQPPPVLINGRKIRLRWLQSALWGALLGAVAAAVVAGLYFNLFEVHWHLTFGSAVNWQGFSLKDWWDSGMGVFHSKSWTLYRHGERDDGEPALAIMAAFTVMAGAKYWSRRAGRTQLALTPAVFVVLALALIAGAVWLQFFGLPDAWHFLFGARRLYVRALAPVCAVGETFLFGFGVQHILKPLWGPVGTHIQGSLTEYPVDRWWRRHGFKATRGGALDERHLPLWVRHPLAPPSMRERFAQVVRDDFASGEAFTVMAQRTVTRHPLRRAAAAAAVLVVLYLAVTGLLAHYYIASGGHVPYLAPAAAAAHTPHTAHTAF